MKPTAGTELAYRANGGTEVALYWDAEAGELFVCVADHESNDAFAINVAADRALDAFYHPYAYASRLDAPVLTRPTPMEAVQ